VGAPVLLTVFLPEVEAGALEKALLQGWTA
jgi:hypothetical protein